MEISSEKGRGRRVGGGAKVAEVRKMRKIRKQGNREERRA